MRRLLLANLASLLGAATWSQPARAMELSGSPLVTPKPTYADVASIAQSMSKDGMKIVTPTEKTWKTLGDKDRTNAFEALQQIQQANLLPAERQMAASRLKATADLTAATRLAQSGGYPNLQMDRFTHRPAWDDWKTSKDEPTFSFAAAVLLAKYRADELNGAQKKAPYIYPRVTPWEVEPKERPKALPRGADPSQQMTTNLTAVPQLQGSPPKTQGQAILASMGGGECLDQLASLMGVCQSKGVRLDAIELTAAKAAKAEEGVDGELRRPDPFNPIGFLEVVKIENDYDDKFTCSGTLIAADLVLTAKHCVKAFFTEHMKVKIPVRDRKEFANCKKAIDEGKGYTRPCVGFKAVRLAVQGAVRTHPNAKIDLALLKLAAVVEEPRRTVAVVSFDDTWFDKLSAAGYGDGRVVKTREQQDAIEVGWFIGHLDLTKDGLMAWRNDPTKGNTASCRGDSGGPVFKGTLAGYDNDPKPRELVAVITEASSKKCGNHEVMQTRMASAEVKDWLCKQPDVPSGTQCTEKQGLRFYRVPSFLLESKN